MRYELIGVPTSAGAYGIGLERAPTALRDAGLLDIDGVDVTDGGDLPTVAFRPDPEHRTAQNIDAVIDVVERVRSVVADTIATDQVPILVGGDCTITLGVVAGVLARHPDAMLAYFDGDVDLSTPQDTRSGVLDAMGIAHLLNIDGVHPGLASIGGSTPLLAGEQLTLIGYEAADVTVRQQKMLTDRGVNLFPAERFRADLDATLMKLGATLGDRPRIVHFDVDAVDSIDLPLAEYPHFNSGVDLNTAGRILASLTATTELAAIVITEVNPLHDPEDVYVPRLCATIKSALRR